MLSPEIISGLVVVTFVAAALNGVAGFGFALIAVAALATVLDPKSAIIITSLLAPPLAVLLLVRHRAHSSVFRRVMAVMTGAVAGALVGTQLLILLPGFVLSITLGLFALWYVFGSLKAEPLQLAAGLERIVGPAIGIVAGLTNGALGASGPVLGSYLMALGLQPRQFVFAISSLFAVMGAIRIGVLGIMGEYTPFFLVLSLLLIPSAVLGQTLGIWLQQRISVATFRRVILALLLVAGFNLLLQGIAGAIEMTSQ